MYICICKAVTDKDIHRAVDQGICSFDGLAQKLGVALDCGACSGSACRVLETAIALQQEKGRSLS